MATVDNADCSFCLGKQQRLSPPRCIVSTQQHSIPLKYRTFVHQSKVCVVLITPSNQLHLSRRILGIDVTSWQGDIHAASYNLVLKCVLTTGALLGHGLAVPQSLETGQSLRWLHGDFFHDSPVRPTVNNEFQKSRVFFFFALHPEIYLVTCPS